MVKAVCIGLGAVLLLVAVWGFFNHTMMGMHCSNAHNAVHLVTGAAALFFGLKSESSARRFAQIFGVVYFLLGLVGLFAGPGVFTLPDAGFGTADDHLLKVIPGHLEFGTADSAVHVMLGTIFAIIGFIPRGLERKIDIETQQQKERAGAGR
jgi:hypothetical protein